MSDINPNSRAAFVDGHGRLSKYGMDTLLKLYRALDFSGNESIIDSLSSEGSSSEGVSTIRPEVFSLNKKLEALSQSTENIYGIRAEIAAINKKIDDLNQTIDYTVVLSTLNTLKKRIETIEAQI